MVDLTEGDNTIYAIIHDAVGHSTMAKVTITYQPPLPDLITVEGSVTYEPVYKYVKVTVKKPKGMLPRPRWDETKKLVLDYYKIKVKTKHYTYNQNEEGKTVGVVNVEPGKFQEVLFKIPKDEFEKMVSIDKSLVKEAYFEVTIDPYNILTESDPLDGKKGFFGKDLAEVPQLASI